jgi:two-component system sensor histidine kinase ChvG
MESSLREAEQQALLAVANTLATSLRGRTDLLYRASERPDPAAGGFVAIPLVTQPTLDGQINDWPRAPNSWREFASRRNGTMRVLAGEYERYVYLLVEAEDRSWVFDASDASALEPGAAGDRLWLAFDTPDGRRAEYFLSGAGAGGLRGRRVQRADYGQLRAIDEPRISAAWTRSASGWRMEIQLPLGLLGQRFGLVFDDRDQRGAAAVSVGNLTAATLAGGGPLLAAHPDLRAYLENFRQPGVRLAVGTAQGATLAQVDALPVPAALSPAQTLLSRFYRRLLERSDLAQRVLDNRPFQLDAPLAAEAAAGRTGTALLATADERRLIVAVAAPIRAASSDAVLGVLQVAQTSDRWLSLRDRALTRLMNMTLLVTVIAFLIALAFASWLARRLIALRDAAGTAVSNEGKLLASFPGTDAPDELGAVARSFSALLERLSGYTNYLRTLAGKLSHEIRTPLTIVRSSLDNLDREALSPAAREYAVRAREGCERLGGIVVAMGAATRVEEAISQADRMRFDLRELLASACESYKLAFPDRRFALQASEQPLVMTGAPDLLLQMLDKLIDNAVDFSPVNSLIQIKLNNETERAFIDVENSGPLLPAGAERLIFESLWQSRPESQGKPHFGLGLYISRLVAEFHGGSVSAANLDDGTGVRFRVSICATL